MLSLLLAMTNLREIRLDYLDRVRLWGGGGNFYALTDFFYCYTILFIWKKASKLKNIDCLRLGW